MSRRTRFFSKRPAISQAVSQRRVLAVLRNALPSYQRRCLPHEQFCHFSPSDAYQGGCVNRNRMYFWVIDKMNSERLTCEESHFYYMNSLKLIFALACPPLAFLSTVFGNRAGLNPRWQEVLFAVFIVVGIVSGRMKNSRPFCQSHSRNGQPCRRTAAVGEKFCFQHSQGWRMKLRSLPANKTLNFWLTVVSILATFVTPQLEKRNVLHPPATPTGFTATVQ